MQIAGVDFFATYACACRTMAHRTDDACTQRAVRFEDITSQLFERIRTSSP
jgi:hypothetical protein